MHLEQGRALVQGMLMLIFSAIAHWVSSPVGLALLSFMGVMRIQESVTDWCPSDLVLRPMGLERKLGTTRAT